MQIRTLTREQTSLDIYFLFGRVENFAHFDKYFPGVSFAIYAFIIKIFPQNFKIEILHFINLITQFLELLFSVM